jgi:DHA2 family multidrug resistance protein
VEAACGWLTDNYSWRWVFYINVPIGVLALFLTQAFIFDPPYLRKQSKGIDYWGIGLLVLGIGSLQIMLDKGQEDDWFSSHFILTLAVPAIIGLGGLIIRELKAEHPIIDLSVFRYRSYAIGTFIMTVVGFVLYGSTVLLPLLMQELLGYTATHAGVTNLPRGMASFLFMPLVGFSPGRSMRESFSLRVFWPLPLRCTGFRTSVWAWLRRISGCRSPCRARDLASFLCL